jgi:uridine phosphorylase
VGGARYHLTPAALVGERFAPDHFGDIRVALVGYCPPPSILNSYRPEPVAGQPFIHVSPDSVRILHHGGRRVLSLAHVYGGPVSSATAEELAYFGITHILAYGLAGGLGSKGIVMGDFYLVTEAWSFDGTTPHYSPDPLQLGDAGLSETIRSLWTRPETLHPVRAATGDAIYREDDALLASYRAKGCDIVNLDSAHLFAASRINSAGRSVAAIQAGVISDVVSGASERAESALSAMLSGDPTGFNPLERTGEIVRFYLETLLPHLD